MTKLNTLAATLAVAVGTAGCATPDPYAAKQTETAPQPQTLARASVTFGNHLCEARIRASDTADMAKLKITRLTSPEAKASPKTNLPSDKECLTAILGVPGGKTKTEFSYAAVDLPNCVQNNSAAASALGDGLNTLATTITQQVMRGGSADAQQAARGALNKAAKGAQQPTKTTTGISPACKADLSEAYDLASKAIAEMKTAYADGQGVPLTRVQVIQVPTFDPKYWVPAAPSKK